jgi:5-methyltetrahydrofolate--homocysteine methyltransferase
MTDLNLISSTLIKGDAKGLTELVQKAVDEETPPGEILNKSLLPAMDVVGERMEDGEMFIPEVLMSAKAMSAALEILKPLLGEGDTSSAGRVVIGTVKGDLHDIGKNLVMMMMESSGFEVINLGTDIGPEGFVQAVKEHKPQFVAMSALLTTTMTQMEKTIAALTENGLRDGVKVVVGGAPVTKAFSDKIGADGYAPDAGSGAKLVKSLH